jgi:sugar/nucleoside kinase (ribokinase family)
VAQQLDILSVGDVVTDAFIKLFDDLEHVVETPRGKMLQIPFGTKLPFESVDIIKAVGNASNAAVAFARLGLKTGFVTNVGGDLEGHEVIRVLGKDRVDTRFVRINPTHKTNYHYVLRYKEERTILIKHEKYDYRWPHIRKNEVPRWLYFSSVSEGALDYHDEVVEWLEENPEVHLAFQPGTFQMKAGTKRLHKLYKRTDVLILNREEAALVSQGSREDIPDLFNRLHALGPHVVVITDGPDGAYASDGINRYKMPLYPDPAKPVDRTGAGDSFASTFVAALAKGCNLEDALRWAPVNSMSVVQKVGATAGLLRERELQQWLHHAPKNYHPVRF